MKMPRLIAALTLGLLCSLAQAQTIRILVGYPPGGGVDVLARMFATSLSEALGQTVIVDNRAGASGQLAAQALKAAAPDGNTLLLTPDAVMVVAPHTYKKIAYSPLDDFVAVAHSGAFEYGLIVGGSQPAKSLKDWIDGVKSNPKNGSYATPGLGTGPHFVGMMLSQALNLPLEAISYKGVAPAINDVVGGQIPAAMLPYGQLEPFIKAGKLKPLAQSGDRRASFGPDVPTFKELGYPAVELVGWYGIFAPAGTSPEIIQRYNAIINKAQSTPDVRQRMAQLGLGIKEMSPDALNAMVRSDYARWRTIVKSTGYSAQSN